MAATDAAERTALVTGGCGPLGWEIVSHLGEAGMRVIAADLPERVAERERSGSRSGVVLATCDLTSAEDLQALVQRVGDSLDVLVNNAAYTGTSALGGYAVPFDEQSDEAFDAALALNLAVPFRLVRRLAPALRAARGVVVNVSSIYGLVGPDLRLYDGTSMGNPAGYAASKGGLVQLTRYLATVLAPDVRANCVAPGGIARKQDPAFVERYVAETPLGRMATEADVAAAVAWLASDGAAYVTGQVIAVDGGWTAR